MNITLTDSKNKTIFTEIFHQLCTISDHITLDVSQERIFIQGMDQTHSCLFEIILNADWFEHYDVDEPTVISLSSAFLYRILNTREDSQNIEITYNNTDELCINLTSEKNTSIIDKYFELPLINIVYEPLTIPEKDYQVEFTFNSKHFASLIDQLAIFDELLKIICNEEHIYLESSGSEGKMRAELSIDDVDEYALEEMGQDLVCMFSLKQIKDMCAFHKITDNVTINLHNEKPIELEYNIKSLENKDLVSVQLYLSPKISEDY